VFFFLFLFIFLIVIVFDLIFSINVAYSTSISVVETLKNLNLGGYGGVGSRPWNMPLLLKVSDSILPGANLGVLAKLFLRTRMFGVKTKIIGIRIRRANLGGPGGVCSGPWNMLLLKVSDSILPSVNLGGLA
jgi:hypothetical protein